MRLFLKNNRGVSEIIASLVLVLVVSAAGVLLYSYSLSSFSSSNSFFQLQMGQREERFRERFLTTATWWNKLDLMNVTIVNYGGIDLKIDAIYVNATLVSNYVSGKGIMVETGGIFSVIFTSPLVIQSSQTYEITVVSERGTKNVFFWKAT